MRYKVAIRFAVEGDLRFISHHDTMRLFERALARAQLPARFSEGFNPRPRLSLPLPRTVGVASDAELCVMEFKESVEAAEVLCRLAEQMPGGLRLHESWPLEPATSVHPEEVEYAVALPEDEACLVAGELEQLLQAPRWLVQRAALGARPGKTIDLRAFLTAASMEDGLLRWVTCVRGDGSARPAEMLAAVGLEPPKWHHHIRRTRVRWSLSGRGVSDFPGTMPGDVFLPPVRGPASP